MNKKTIIAMTIAAMCVGTCLARPHGGPGFGGGPRGGFHGGFGYRPAPVMHHSYHHHGSFWGRGGSHFWPGFVGGVIGGALTSSIYPTTTVVASPIVTTPIVTTPVVTTPVVTTPVVTTPVYTTQSVWVEGRYVDQVQANGTVVRVYQPGHYEQRSVLVQ